MLAGLCTLVIIPASAVWPREVIIMRRSVVLIGLLVVLAGLTEIILPEWSIFLAHGLFRVVPIVIAGIVGLVIGLVLLAAASRRLVGLRLFVMVVGGVAIALGLVAIAEPGLVKDLGYALLLRRSWGFQLAVLWTTGILRILLGGALVYAAMKPPPRPATLEQ